MASAPARPPAQNGTRKSVTEAVIGRVMQTLPNDQLDARDDTNPRLATRHDKLQHVYVLDGPSKRSIFMLGMQSPSFL
jgi:hypothetical protein